MKYPILTTILILGFVQAIYAQDSTKSLININNTKIVKKVNALLDSNQKKIAGLITKRTDSIQSKFKSTIKNALPKEVEKPLPYETLKDKKYTLTRRAYQNTVSQFNYFFNASEELNEMIFKARTAFQEDYTELLPFYDYDLSFIAKNNIDSIIYRCNANIVLHDLRSNWVDDAYLLLAKAYLYHKNFDTAGSILQFINYSFYDKDDGADRIMGSNLNTTKGKFSIASPDNNRIWENGNVRNESLVWQARNNFEIGEINEGMNLLKMLQVDYNFPSYLHPFLYEQLAYGYYLSDMYDSAATNLIKGLDNAIDINAKSRWYFLIGQLYDKAKKHKEAYPWYEKASNASLNPVLSIYAKINAIHILANDNKEPWLQLASSLEKMSSREKYHPYSDIIYYEMAKLAIENKDHAKATDWLIQSIRKNKTNPKLKQNAFEILADINYQDNQFHIAAKAYENLNGVLKTHPQFETIQLRKKWINTLSDNFTSIAIEDSLQAIYQLPSTMQDAVGKHVQSYFEKQQSSDAELFIEKENTKKGKDKENSSNLPIPSFNASNNSFNNPLENNNQFYFENKNALSQGSNQFKQKWGDRPNVDNWRRKTSLNIVSTQQNASIATNQNILTTIQTNTNKKNTENVAEKTKKANLSFTLLKDSSSYIQSIEKEANLLYKNASILLFYLNDFDKAYPIYQKLIATHYNATTTERALLDLASAYIRKGQSSTSDSIIRLVSTRFPNGFYMKKKQESEAKKNLIDLATQYYKEAYFLTQIGNWDSLQNLHIAKFPIIRSSKWNTPYQFLRVKMYAQERLDSNAMIILDSIILLNQNEIIRDKAKTIIAELKNRKNTEQYLASLVIQRPVMVQEINPMEASPSSSNQAKNINQSQPNLIDSIAILNTVKDSTGKNKSEVAKMNTTSKSDSVQSRIAFTNDASEPHYLALVLTGTKEVLLKEAQNAFNFFHLDEYKKWALTTSFVQFNETQHIIWIGPFQDLAATLKYTNAVKPRLKDEIISFIPPKNYELYIFGKSNILLIKNKADLDQYKSFMQQHIIK